MVYVLLADGFEESEAIVPVDILKRGGVRVTLVGVTGEHVKSARGISIKTDIPIRDVAPYKMEMLMLPGGQPGVDNLWSNSSVHELVKYSLSEKKHLAAICAAPIIPGRLGALDGKKAACYPGFEGELKGAEYLPDLGVVTDGSITTARAAGDAFEFGFRLLGLTAGEDAAQKVKDDICY